MERLTERTTDGILVKEDYGKEVLKTLYSCYGGKPNPHYTNCEEGYCAMEKLATYEDAEEQGRLVKLPCKVGDVVYRINIGAMKPVIPLRVVEYRFKIVGNCIREKICCSDDFLCKQPSIIYYAEDIGNKVFLTKSEAEARLKELRGGE